MGTKTPSKRVSIKRNNTARRAARRRRRAEMQPLEDRLLLSFTASITSAPTITGSNYVAYLNTVGTPAAKWTVDWGDGMTSPPYLASAEPGGVFPANFQISHTYTSPGSFNVVATATDAANDPAVTAPFGLSASFGDSIPGSSPTAQTGSTTGPASGFNDPITVDRNPSNSNYGDVYLASDPASFSPISITRYTPNGQVDSTWGSSGTLTLPSFVPGSPGDLPNKLALSPDGSSLAVTGFYNNRSGWETALLSTASGGSVTWQKEGYVNSGNSANGVVFDVDGSHLDVAGYDTNNNFEVAQLNLSDGSLNTGFASGTGIKQFSFSFPYNFVAGGSLVQLPDGHLIVGATINAGYSDFGLAELNANGSMDTAFNGTGSLRTNFKPGAFNSQDVLNDLVVWNDPTTDKPYIIAAGSSLDYRGSGLYHTALARYDAVTGALDSRFSQGDPTPGLVLASGSGATSVTLGPGIQGDNGQIIVSDSLDPSQPINAWATYAFTNFGALDPTFGNSGEIDYNFGSPSGSNFYSTPQAITLAADNSVIVAGPVNNSGSTIVGLANFLSSNRLTSGNATITGNAFADANGDAQQQSTESVLPGVHVEVTDNAGDLLGLATTDANGNYTLNNVPSGMFLDVSASASGYASPDHTISSIAANGSQTIPLPMQRTLPAPFNLTATRNSDTQITLNWSDFSAGAETGFKIYESVAGGAFTQVDTAASGATSKPMAVNASTDYVFRVAAYDADGISNFSNPADADGPPQPTNFGATAANVQDGGASVVLNWDAGQPGETFNIYRANGTDTPTTLVASNVSGTTWTDTNVSAGATFSYLLIGGYMIPAGGATSPPSPALTATIPSNTNQAITVHAAQLTIQATAGPNQSSSTRFGAYYEKILLGMPTIPNYTASNPGGPKLAFVDGLSEFGLGTAFANFYMNGNTSGSWTNIETANGNHPAPQVTNDGTKIPKPYTDFSKNGIGMSAESLAGNRYVEVCGDICLCSQPTMTRVAMATLSGLVTETWSLTHM